MFSFYILTIANNSISINESITAGTVIIFLFHYHIIFVLKRKKKAVKLVRKESIKVIRTKDIYRTSLVLYVPMLKKPLKDRNKNEVITWFQWKLLSKVTRVYLKIKIMMLCRIK